MTDFIIALEENLKDYMLLYSNLNSYIEAEIKKIKACFRTNNFKFFLEYDLKEERGELEIIDYSKKKTAIIEGTEYSYYEEISINLYRELLQEILHVLVIKKLKDNLIFINKELTEEDKRVLKRFLKELKEYENLRKNK